MLGVIGAFPVFWYLRRKAAQEAREVIQENLANMYEEIEAKAIAKLEELLPELIEEYGKFAQGAISGEVADLIAAAQDEEPDQDADH